MRKYEKIEVTGVILRAKVYCNEIGNLNDKLFLEYRPILCMGYYTNVVTCIIHFSKIMFLDY